MSDYISREAAIEAVREEFSCETCNGSNVGTICTFCNVGEAIRLIKNIPAADVEPVRRGRWEHKKNDYSVAWYSNCKGLFDITWHGKNSERIFCAVC